MPKKKSTATPSTPKKTGRPPSAETRVTISFRVPRAVQDAFVDLADEQTRKELGRVVRVSDLYNQALAEFAAKRKVKIKGWNA